MTNPMKIRLLFPLAPLAALLCGCPHNQYLVEITPHADALERALTFYREKDVSTNGVITYEDFPANELAAITRLYPAGQTRTDGQRHVARGVFAGALPAD